MNGGCIIAGAVCLILAGLVGAEYVSTSLSTDGTFMLAGSGHNDNGSYASRFFGTDRSEISRSISAGESLESDVAVRGEGPVLVSEYASGRSVPIPDDIACAFITALQRQEHESEMYTAGILNRGRYSASRVIGPGLTGGTEMNGSGMVSFGSHTVGNTTMRSSGFVSGNMSLRDFVKYGGKI